MTKSIEFSDLLKRLESGLDTSLLLQGLIGVEKESLRTDSAGLLARTAHPAALGSALTNPYITTDFSEALLEFVTPAHRDYWQTHQFLCDLHVYTYRNIGDELLWVSSMPCRVGADETIPLAHYGSSNVGTMKTVYRRGLGHRYGRLMQTIAGLHFNYSLAPEIWPELGKITASELSGDDFRSASYLGLLRNFRRFGWIILYLFGSSPAMCKSFIDDPYSSIPELDAETLFEPYATSLRMSDLGYSNKNQSRIRISLNSLKEYVTGLCAAITTPEPDYQDIGVKIDGVYRQLNSNTLQIENEYYSPMRPKKVALTGQRPTTALARGGIDYVELRSLDLNVFDPVGISESQARFLEVFLLYCALSPSPMISDEELAQCSENHALTARLGRDPGLMLRRGDEEVLLSDWALGILDQMNPLAELLNASGGAGYVESVSYQRRAVRDSDRTPSARIIAELVDSKKSFFEFGLECARGHRDYFLSLDPVNEQRMVEFSEEAGRSIAAQREIENSDSITFDEYLGNYFDDLEC